MASKYPNMPQAKVLSAHKFVKEANSRVRRLEKELREAKAAVIDAKRTAAVDFVGDAGISAEWCEPSKKLVGSRVYFQEAARFLEVTLIYKNRHWNNPGWSFFSSTDGEEWFMKIEPYRYEEHKQVLVEKSS